MALKSWSSLSLLHFYSKVMKPALKLPPNITVFENIKKYRIGNYFYFLPVYNLDDLHLNSDFCYHKFFFDRISNHCVQPNFWFRRGEVYVMNGDLDGVNPKVVRKDSREKQREKSFRFWYRVWAHTSPYRGKLCWQDRIGWPLGYRLFWPWSKVPWPNFGCRSALASAGGLPHPRTNL